MFGRVLHWSLRGRVVISLTVLVVLGGCGRYRIPLPPEMLAPSAVETLVVTPSEDSVALSWGASDIDRRGKELKSAEGFIVERKELVSRGDETDPTIKFKELEFIADKHVEVREKLRKEARAAGKIGRTVESPAEYTQFKYTDSTPERGKTYLYQVVPVNQGGTKGRIDQLAKVVFQGAQSAVVMVASQEALDTAAGGVGAGAAAPVK